MAGTSTGSITASVTTGTVLQNNSSAAPTYSTATFPSTATSTGTILRANGTNWAASTATFADTYTASNILYSNGANTVTGLATANSGVLTTSTAGVPSIDTTNFSVLTTGVQVKGNNTNTAPPAGFIGQLLNSSVARAGAVSAGATTVAANITSVSLTAGIWDIYAQATIVASAMTVTQAAIGINTTSATMPTDDGTNRGSMSTGATAAADQSFPSIVKLRATLSGTTTYYLVASMTYSVGSPTLFGNITATRVG